MVLRQALFGLSQQQYLKQLATRTPVARKVAGRFVAGETLAEALAVVRALNQEGMTATLDHLGENVSTREEAAGAADEYITMLREIHLAGARANVSLKLTHMGLDLGREVAAENVLRVVQTAAELDNFVRIDMESSEYVDATLEIFSQIFTQVGHVGTVIQSYLYRSAHDLERLNEMKARVRLVKGAYLEPPEVAYQRKADVDWNFVRLMEALLSRGTYPAIATHDPLMIEATKRYAAEHQITPDRFEFQMLYGIRRDLQHALVAEGYRMRVYVPFGTEWYPYLMRRMAERPANVMFVLGNIAREAVPGR